MPAASSSRAVRFGLLAFAAYLLLGAGWALALPADGTYDEKQHIVRAYAVVDGQLLPTGQRREETFLGTDAFHVPAGLLPGDPHCLWYPKAEPASCQLPNRPGATVLRTSGAARYSPVYYAAVGWPLRLWPDQRGVIGARLVSALICAALFGLSWALLSRLGNPLVPAALALVVTPMTVNLAGAVNPNGVEIAAAVLLFAALLTVLRAGDPAGTLARWPVRFAALAALLLVVARQLGPLLAAVALGAIALAAPRGRLPALLHRAQLRRWLGGALLLGLGGAVVWAGYSRAEVPLAPTDRATHLHGSALLQAIAEHRLPFDVIQLVGQFGYGETHVSRWLVAGWYALVVALISPTLWRVRHPRSAGAWRPGAAMLLLGTVSLAVLVALDLVLAPGVGWVAQGRYVLPLVVGIPLIAVAGSDAPDAADVERGAERRAAVLGAIVVAAVAVAQVWAFGSVLARYRLGPGATDPLAGGWSPITGAVLPLALVVLGAVLLAATGLIPPGQGGALRGGYPRAGRTTGDLAVAER